MRFDVDQPAGAGEGGMIGAAFVESDSQKVADAERIGGPLGDTAFRIDALEIADEEGAEVDARGEAGPAHFFGVELLAGSFGELVELFGVEQFIEPSVKGVSGRGRQLLLGDPQCLVTDPLLPCSQRHTQFYAETFSASIEFSRRADFNHGLLTFSILTIIVDTQKR